MQRSIDYGAISKVDRDSRNRPHRLPSWFKILVDEVGNFLIGEQHGSRDSSIRSCEALIQLTQQLEMENRLP